MRLKSDEDASSALAASDVSAFLREVARAAPRLPPDAGEPPGPDPLLGHVIDAKYRVDSALGRGGMGTVYRAVHLGTERAVALKVLVPALTADEAAVERFRREARTTGQIRHPNIVDVTDFGFTERGGVRFAYLVMELLQGNTLRAVLEEGGRLDLDVALDVLAQVCAGIAEAHRLGILHRDLKPENIHLEPRARGRYRAKVLDFGIAKLVHEAWEALPDARAAAPPPSALPALPSAMLVALGEADTARLPESGSSAGSLTRVGGAIGTPRYMSPEQWLGNANDVRTDIYSLAVVAYEMLAGAPPFLGKEMRVALDDTAEEPPSLRAKVPSVPRAVDRVISAALAKDPAARPPSVAAFDAALHSGAETTGNLLRRSIALGAEHFLLFSRRCVLLTLPPVAFAAIDLVADVLARAGLVSPRVVRIIDGVATLGELLSVFAWAPVLGMTVTVVADLLSVQGTPRPPPSGAELWRTTRRAFPSSVASFIFVAAAGAIALGLWAGLGKLVGWTRFFDLISASLFVLLASAALTPFAVFGAVSALEGAGGLLPLRRSAALLRPMWRAAFGVELVYNALMQGLPELVTLALRGVATSAPIAQPAFDIERVRPLLLWLVTVAFMPFVMVPFALLYLRAREAEGNPLDREAKPTQPATW